MVHKLRHRRWGHNEGEGWGCKRLDGSKSGTRGWGGETRVNNHRRQLESPGADAPTCGAENGAVKGAGENPAPREEGRSGPHTLSSVWARRPEFHWGLTLLPQ